ncbi:MAG: hypothetical protein JSV59_01395 [Flavobacteriaceae bacterium]|nr:MAG: hypothetical protein JSV59_01395 [Flavobacteriaceae bacterium]
MILSIPEETGKFQMAIFASLSSITCPGSLGIISAYPESIVKIVSNQHYFTEYFFSGVRTPFEMIQSYDGSFIFHNKTP